MTESDFEIEYLDEDEDLVQQCVQASDNTDSVPVALSKVPAPTSKYVVQLKVPDSSSSSLLVERTRAPRSYKKKRSREDEDSDYDPSEDVVPGPRRYKRRMQTSTPRPNPTIERRPNITHTMTKKEELQFRRSMGLKIPNFEDPLCLPVKAILKEESDLRKLKNWNNLCLNHYKNHDTALKPDVGDTVASQRTVVLRTVKNKLTGKNETTLWGKLTVQSEKDKKSEVFQGVLPKYREGKVLELPLSNSTRKAKTVRSTETVVLTKEDDKGEVLVVYKPQQALSAVYKLMEEDKEEGTEAKKDEDKKQYLKELTVCKMCAPCYQGSWRGYKTTANKKKSVICPICARSFVSVYNLLAHVKTHNASDVKAYKRVLCKTLAKVVDYHYKCRICQLKCPSIKDLRRHVLVHQANEPFQCEVCNRVPNLTTSS